MIDLNKWKLVHDYRRLTMSGVAPDLRCPEDGAIYATKIDSDDEPVLHCFDCSTTLTPGLALLKQMESAVAHEAAKAKG